MTNLKNATEGLKTGTGSPVRTPRKKQEEILAALACYELNSTLSSHAILLATFVGVDKIAAMNTPVAA